MHIMNDGYIKFSKKNEKKVVNLLLSNGAGDLFGIEKGDTFAPDKNGDVAIYIEPDFVYGDIESRLSELTAILKDNGFLVNGEIK